MFQKTFEFTIYYIILYEKQEFPPLENIHKHSSDPYHININDILALVLLSFIQK